MPIRDEPQALLDTSVAVPFVLRAHPMHDGVFAALRSIRRGLAGHAAFETYSALTRMPPPYRLEPGEASAVISREFGYSRHLDDATAGRLVEELSSAGIAGGAVYDALVGASARAHGVRLFTRDARAASTYQLLGVDYKLLD